MSIVFLSQKRKTFSSTLNLRPPSFPPILYLLFPISSINQQGDTISLPFPMCQTKSSLLFLETSFKFLLVCWSGVSQRCQIPDLTWFAFAHHKPMEWQNGGSATSLIPPTNLRDMLDMLDLRIAIFHFFIASVLRTVHVKAIHLP